jgi:hypothetical protein
LVQIALAALVNPSAAMKLATPGEGILYDPTQFCPGKEEGL